jgi:hypothetical protein
MLKRQTEISKFTNVRSIHAIQLYAWMHGCMDESPKQLIAETKVSIPVSPGGRPNTTMDTGVAAYAMFPLSVSHWQESAWSKSQKEKPSWTRLVL